MHPRPQFICFTLTLLFSATGLQHDLHDEGRVAVCFAGQFRSFAKTVGSASDNLVSAFSNPDVFLFLNLQDSGKGGNGDHAEDIDQILETLNPVSHQYYNEGDIDAFESTMQEGSTCFRKVGTPSCCHYSLHGPQFWATQQCWDMVEKYENANSFRYKYFVRARPDTKFARQLKQAIQIVSTSPFDSGTKHAWLRRGAGSDAFALLTRDAADSYANTFKNSFIGDSCTHLPSENECEPCGAIGMATECLLYRNMLSGGVQVHFDDTYSAAIVRP